MCITEKGEKMSLPVAEHWRPVAGMKNALNKLFAFNNSKRAKEKLEAFDRNMRILLASGIALPFMPQFTIDEYNYDFV